MTSKLSQIGQVLFKDVNHYPKSEYEACQRMAEKIIKDRDRKPTWYNTYFYGISTWIWCMVVMGVLHIMTLFPDSRSEVSLTLSDWVFLPIGFAILASIVLTIAERAFIICAKQPELDWVEKYRPELDKD